MEFRKNKSVYKKKDLMWLWIFVRALSKRKGGKLD